jgi:hypothetical protein
MRTRELELVELQTDMPELGLTKGMVGTVVFIYPKGRSAEVEFLDAEGQTIAVETLPLDFLKSLPFRKEAKKEKAFIGSNPKKARLRGKQLVRFLAREANVPEEEARRFLVVLGHLGKQKRVIWKDITRLEEEL